MATGNLTLTVLSHVNEFIIISVSYCLIRKIFIPKADTNSNTLPRSHDSKFCTLVFTKVSFKQLSNGAGKNAVGNDDKHPHAEFLSVGNSADN